jgi:AcrR family transcriptional regulator
MTTVSDDRHAEPGFEPGLRERKKLQTRQAIHEAALHLIDEQGLEATTIDQICGAADVSSRTFFNYFPSKAAALLQLPDATISPEVRSRFLAARGGLVLAMCDVVGSSSEATPDRGRMKKLVARHPELLSIVMSMMTETRSQYIALASERASSPEQADLAVTIVMTAFGRLMHDQNDSDAPIATRLRALVGRMAATFDEQLV